MPARLFEALGSFLAWALARFMQATLHRTGSEIGSMQNRWIRAKAGMCTADENRLIPQGETGGKLGRWGHLN